MGVGAKNGCETTEYGGEQPEYSIKQIEYEGVYKGCYSFTELHNSYLLSLASICFMYTIHPGAYVVTYSETHRSPFLCCQALIKMLCQLIQFHPTRRF